jgi:2'-5' RNA ligase
MNYATVLYFDQDSENKIKDYLALIKNNGIDNSFYNLGALQHISLAVYNDDVDYPELVKGLEKFQLNKMKISFTNVGFFCSDEYAVFLNPKITCELLDVHKRYHKEFKKYIHSEKEYYLPENWVPHSTIAFEMNDDDFMKTLKIMKENFKPIDVTIEKIGFVKFKPIKRLYMRNL